MKLLSVFALFIAGFALVAARGSPYVNCPHLYAPSHGRVVTSGYRYGSIARYYCNNGYGLYYPGYAGPYASGNYYYRRTCQHGGIWAGPIPQCLSSSQYYYNYYNYPYAGRPYYDDYSYGYGMYGRGGRHLYGDPYYQNRHGDGHHGDRYPYYDYNY